MNEPKSVAIKGANTLKLQHPTTWVNTVYPDDYMVDDDGTSYNMADYYLFGRSWFTDTIQHKLRVLYVSDQKLVPQYMSGDFINELDETLMALYGTSNF